MCSGVVKGKMSKGGINILFSTDFTLAFVLPSTTRHHVSYFFPGHSPQTLFRLPCPLKGMLRPISVGIGGKRSSGRRTSCLWYFAIPCNCEMHARLLILSSESAKAKLSPGFFCRLFPHKRHYEEPLQARRRGRLPFEERRNLSGSDTLSE
jgi:hypothetical protein